MPTLTDIEAAVSRLAPEDFAAFRDWFASLQEERFDAQIAADERSGRLDRLVQQALDEVARGHVRDL